MKTRRALKGVFVAGMLWMLSLTAGATAIVLAEFGAPVWVFVGLFAWLLIPGLPTLVAVLLVTQSWQGPSFQAYLLTAALLAFFFQLAAVLATRWGITRWRRKLAE